MIIKIENRLFLVYNRSTRQPARFCSVHLSSKRFFFFFFSSCLTSIFLFVVVIEIRSRGRERERGKRKRGYIIKTIWLSSLLISNWIYWMSRSIYFFCFNRSRNIIYLFIQPTTRIDSILISLSLLFSWSIGFFSDRIK